MEITDSVFEQLANLSRLSFSEEEKQHIKSDLQRMVSFIEKLDEVDIADVPPLLFMSNAVNVWREDEVRGSVSNSEALQNAPQHDEAFFQVPKVIKK
ncbi:MAG: Asp-tRNA(Asn)/Glu-tRNA(Gln) amidotransferase subunit GatC [Filimonas sp.]|nr:Asp-tRNA(Asn)/Glu-tRNA(Gln) amidotransferase subunit GatC [Filimonas sp.]